MVASHKSIEQMIKIILKHMSKETARAMVREMYHTVDGNKSVMDTLCRLAQEVENHE